MQALMSIQLGKTKGSSTAQAIRPDRRSLALRCHLLPPTSVQEPWSGDDDNSEPASLPQRCGQEAQSSPQDFQKTWILWLAISTSQAGVAKWEQINNVQKRKILGTTSPQLHGALAVSLMNGPTFAEFVKPPNPHTEWLIRKHSAFETDGVPQRTKRVI